MIALGAVFITGEYRRGMIRTTLAASPRRGRVLAAKAIVIGSVTFVAGLTGAAVAFPFAERKLNALGWNAAGVARSGRSPARSGCGWCSAPPPCSR